MYFGERKSYGGALWHCQKKGGYLAKLHSQELLDFVSGAGWKVVWTQGWKEWGTWYWQKNENVTREVKEGWAEGEPKKGNDDRILFLDGKLYGRHRQDELPFLCEFERRKRCKIEL